MRLILHILLVVLSSPLWPQVASAAPWRIATASWIPSWFHVGATHRTRYEHLQNQFRSGVPGNDRALSLRTTLAAELRFSPLVIGAELADSRAYLLDDNTPVNTSIVNPFELLQGYVGANLRDLFLPGATGRLRAGRMTINLGSRRLVARNGYRNTINAFNGLQLQWTSPLKHSVRLFATMPIQRRPTGQEDLTNNVVELDRENVDALFWGAFYASRPWPARIRTEAYIFGLHERDSDAAASRDRQLVTPGGRLYRSPKPGAIDFEIEVAIQGGTSSSSSSSDDSVDLQHVAFLAHAALGYTLNVPWSPRLLLQYDYASGDADPDDHDNGRFDTLFGGRRFEFGPTGIYGSIPRSNINAPAARILTKPHATVGVMIAYRAIWLAQRRDAWVAARVRDPSGNSGSFIGNQIEARLRWKILPGNVALDVGFTHLWLGELARDAPNASGNGDPTHIYAQVVLEV